MAMPKVPITFKFSFDLANLLRLAAHKNMRSRSEQVARYVKEGLMKDQELPKAWREEARMWGEE